MQGGAGYDQLFIYYRESDRDIALNLADTGFEWVRSEAGNDTLDGSGKTEALYLETKAGADSVVGGSGNDTIYAGGGDNVLVGNDGNDALYGGNGSETIDGGLGNDYIVAYAGANSISGGDGTDNISTAGIWDDTITGGMATIPSTRSAVPM